MNVLAIFDKIFDPVADCLTPDAAGKILAVTADEEIKSHTQELAEKANLGTISPDEMEEYRKIIYTFDMIAICKAKARKALTRKS